MGIRFRFIFVSYLYWSCSIIMAELYPTGEQRIFYRATSDSVDLIVTAVMFDPSLNFSYSLDNFHRLQDRIFSALFNFNIEGIWIAVFYENGIEKATQAYNTKKIPAVGEFKPSHTGRGPNVIG